MEEEDDEDVDGEGGEDEIDEEGGEDEIDEEMSKDLDEQNKEDNQGKIEMLRKRNSTKMNIQKQISMMSGHHGILGHSTSTIINEEGIEEELSNGGIITRNTRFSKRNRKITASGEASAKHNKQSLKSPVQPNASEAKQSAKKVS